jgi:hypothetical protein
MRRIILLTLMSIYLLGNTDIIQLIKLPMIFVHYQNHLNDNGKLDFVYFLTSHYDAAGDGVESDNTEESQLPFMHLNTNVSIIASLSLSKLILIPPFFNSINTKYAEYTVSHTPDVYTISLLRPPISIS